MSRKIVVLVSLCFLCSISLGQNIPKKVLVGLGEVMHGDRVRGYYYFTRVEKDENGGINYELTLQDANLQEINSIKINRPRRFALIESAYNEKNFAFLFFDKSKLQLELIAYDSSLRQVGNFTRTVTNTYEENMLNSISFGKTAEDPFLVSLKETGFINYGFRDGYDPFFRILCFDNDLKVKWAILAPQEDKSYKFISAAEAFHTSEYLGSLVTKQRNSRNEYSLLVHDHQTGKEIMSTKLINEGIALSPSNFSYDSLERKIVVFGEYYDENDREIKDQSKGFAYFIIDMNGKISLAKTLPWSYLSSVAPVTENGKTDGSNTYIYFHDFVRTADGRTFAIGEQYKKSFNGAGFAAALLTGGRSFTSSVHINAYNLIMFQFSSDYSLEKVHFFEKNRTRTILPVGSLATSPKALANYVKSVGGFDYALNHQSEDKETFSAVYIDFDREKTGEFQVGTVTYTPEKTFVSDKISLSKRSRLVKVMRAKPGYIYIMSYLKEGKTLDVRLEKVNY